MHVSIVEEGRDRRETNFVEGRGLNVNGVCPDAPTGDWGVRVSAWFDTPRNPTHTMYNIIIQDWTEHARSGTRCAAICMHVSFEI